MEIPKQGWVENLDDEVYHSLPHLSSHRVMDLLVTPAHYKARLEVKRKETPALRLGKIIHKAVLEPQSFMRSARVMPDFGNMRTKAAQEEKAAWMTEAEGDGATIVSAEEYDRIVAMVAAIKRHGIARNLFSNGSSEVSGFWETERGVKCRLRADYLRRTDRWLIDCKFMESAELRSFQRQAYNYKFHIQAAWYDWGASVIDGVEYEDFLFLVQEKEFPYALQIFRAEGDFLPLGRRALKKGLDIYERCAAEDYWPGYPEGVTSLLPPSYATEE